MPYIQINTNLSLNEEKIQVLKTEFGRAISAFPGKTERWLMVECNPDRVLFMAGSDEPCAIVGIEIFGSANDRAYETMTAKATDILTGALGLSPDRIYVKYREVDRWGWNGGNF